MRRRSPVSSPNGGSNGSNGTNNLRSTSPATYTTSGKATTTTSTNGIHKARHSSESPSTTTTWLPLLPAMTASLLFFSCLLLDVSYHHFVVPIYQSYQRIPLAQDYNFHENFRNEFTYYDRHCSKDDLTTRDSNDLRITPDMNGAQASRVMLEHGAAAIPNILTKETAAYLHKYLANKHAEPLHYNEVFWQEMHRLSLALGTKDHPSVAQALEEVGNNELVKTTLEGILGPDPALVEISTLTARSGCPPQGIHTDSDWFGSSLLYGRSFLHSYSMFIALQDTTQDLGATTVCPGSHMCADVDLEEVCMNHGAFSVSTNGKTGREEGMLFAGDGFLFNQNVWHRGPQNNMDKDRIMFILTFTSSKQKQESKEHDLRRQGLGTYYYQRWNMWGHTLSDLKQATKRMIQPWAGLRALGLLPSKGGIPWIHHFAQQVGPGADFYDDYELGNMKEQLLSNQPSFLFSKSEEWKPFLSETFHLWTLLSGIVYAVVCIGSLVLFPRSKKSALMWNAMLLGLFGVIYLYMSQTELGRSVTSRHIHHRPMAPYHPDKANEGSHRTTFPERNDILFGTRMDSEFLTSFRHFLEYHPGNQDFLSRVAEAATASDASDTVVAQEIVESMIQESEMGLYRRFLYQNHTNGAWELLSIPEAVEQTRRKVLLERDSTKQEEVKDLQHKLSVHRFGLHRESPVSMQAAQETEAALDKVVACRDGAACPNVAMEAPDTDAMGEEPALDSIPNEGDKIWAWDEYEGVWAEAIFLGPKVGDEGEEMYEFYFFSDSTQVKPTHYIRPYYRVRSGDRVIVDYEGHGREFFHGTVKFVYPDGYCHIAFDDGELHHFMPRARVFLPPRGPPMEEGGSAGEVMQE